MKPVKCIMINCTNRALGLFCASCSFDLECAKISHIEQDAQDEFKAQAGYDDTTQEELDALEDFREQLGACGDLKRQYYR